MLILLPSMSCETAEWRITLSLVNLSLSLSLPIDLSLSLSLPIDVSLSLSLAPHCALTNGTLLTSKHKKLVTDQQIETLIFNERKILFKYSFLTLVRKIF